jgi:DNA repair photolyase
MALVKSKGNMYDWVTHMHTHLGGECQHKCAYCYVGKSRFGRPEKYTGPSRLIESELSVKYGVGKTIFIEHMNDLFAQGVRDEWIVEILTHCRLWAENKYVFQTKNPERAAEYLRQFQMGSMIGTTIETNRSTGISMAPPPVSRIGGMASISEAGIRTFITIEPILDFDPPELIDMVQRVKPEFVNIGADSKGVGLIEPSRDKILELIKLLGEAGITIRKKINLGRILGLPITKETSEG